MGIQELESLHFRTTNKKYNLGSWAQLDPDRDLGPPKVIPGPWTSKDNIVRSKVLG